MLKCLTPSELGLGNVCTQSGIYSSIVSFYFLAFFIHVWLGSLNECCKFLLRFVKKILRYVVSWLEFSVSSANSRVRDQELFIALSFPVRFIK